MPLSAVISVLARSLIAGELTAEGAYIRASETLGRRWRWLRPMIVRYVEAFGNRTRARHRDVIQFLLNDAGFTEAWARHGDEISIAKWITEPQRMQPAPPARKWNVPVIATCGDLAEWLSLRDGELEWFSDLKGLGSKLHNQKLHHYRYSILPKRSGGVRLIEKPKRRIKELQSRILVHILDLIPPHESVHGFVKGRSIVSFAAAHTGKETLLRVDLKDFFPAFPGVRVQALFRTLGYPEEVADRLGGICTNAVPRAIWKNRPLEFNLAEWQQARVMYTRPHLPQGAPTSPAIANLTAYRLDCRLSGLAKSAGAVYTRYADDMAFSGNEDFGRSVEPFSTRVAAIAMEEGLSVNHLKTRLMRQGVRQHLAGITVNQKPNPRRRDLDRLEAIVTNCMRFGPESQNRENMPNFRAHLEGRIGFVEMVNREKGRRLRTLFQKIEWS